MQRKAKHCTKKAGMKKKMHAIRHVNNAGIKVFRTCALQMFHEEGNVFNTYFLLFIFSLQLPWRFGHAHELVCTCMHDKAVQTLIHTALFCSLIFQKFHYFQGLNGSLMMISFGSFCIYFSKPRNGSTCCL